MQDCPLHADIFCHFLALDKYYLPVSSFLALRATCRRLWQLYNKQKYVDTYSIKIKVVKSTNDYDGMDRQTFIKEYTRLPNGVKHGLMEKHYFAPVLEGYDGLEPLADIKMISKDFAGEFTRRKLVAKRWEKYTKDVELQRGEPQVFCSAGECLCYDSTTTIQYYFGAITGPKISTCKLLSWGGSSNGVCDTSDYPGSNKVEFVESGIGNSMNVFYWYDGRLHSGPKKYHSENSIKDISSYHIIGEEEGVKFMLSERLDQNGDIVYSYFRYGTKNVEITYLPEIVIKTRTSSNEY